MGTRNLGARPWLVVDERRRAELALKAELLARRHDEVFAALPGIEAGSHEVLDLVRADLGVADVGVGDVGVGDVPAAAGRHPLDEAGRLVQEDLCLLRREASGWVLVGASLCFPSRWRLAEKMGRTLLDVHQPVDGYDDVLAGRVDRLLDGLGTRIVWRRNWFLHPDPALFQPDRPVQPEPTISAAESLDLLYVRSERQTLRTLPISGLMLFTIRIQQEPVRRLVDSESRRVALARFVDEASEELATHRGLAPSQRRELALALG